MSAEMLPFEWPERPAGKLTAAVDSTVAQLRAEERLTQVHDAVVALLYKLADALENAAVGRGASVALLSAQYLAVVKELTSLPGPRLADGEEFDVVFAPIPITDDEPDTLA